MTRLVFGARARQDLARLTDFLLEQDPAAAAETIAVIQDALMILERQPRIGRPAPNRQRELVIHRGRSGYVALYRVDAEADEALVLAIRHQRESGYHAEDL